MFLLFCAFVHYRWCTPHCTFPTQGYSAVPVLKLLVYNHRTAKRHSAIPRADLGNSDVLSFGGEMHGHASMILWLLVPVPCGPLGPRCGRSPSGAAGPETRPRAGTSLELDAG